MWYVDLRSSFGMQTLDLIEMQQDHIIIIIIIDIIIIIIIIIKLTV